MLDDIVFNVRLVSQAGVVTSGNFTSAFENAFEEAVVAFPLFEIETIYPEDHHLRLDWFWYQYDLRRKEADNGASN